MGLVLTWVRDGYKTAGVYFQMRTPCRNFYLNPDNPPCINISIPPPWSSRPACRISTSPQRSRRPASRPTSRVTPYCSSQPTGWHFTTMFQPASRVTPQCSRPASRVTLHHNVPARQQGDTTPQCSSTPCGNFSSSRLVTFSMVY